VGQSEERVVADTRAPAPLSGFEAVAILVLVVTSDGRHDFIDRPLGTDFA